MITRPFTSGGPYGHTPGEPPPFHPSQNDPADQADREDMTRLSGRDDTLNTSGWVGYSDQPGADGAAYRGRDITDPETWNGRPYNEEPGMLTRLHQEAAQNG